MSPSTAPKKGIIVPFDRIAPDTLQRMVEEYVSRDGTDNGYMGAELEKRVQTVMAHLRKGVSVIVYDPQSQTANIVVADDL